jgi:hypothetical protein
MTSLEDVLISVWCQALAEDAAAVEIEASKYAVKSTPRRGLKQVDFRFKGKTCAGWSKIQKRNHDGQRWREGERRSCSSWRTVAIWR